MKENQGCFETLKNYKCSLREEHNFDVTAMFEHAQKGLPTPYRQCDYFAVTQIAQKIPEAFLKAVQAGYLKWNNTSKDICVIVAFSAECWNKLGISKIDIPKQKFTGNKTFMETYKYNLSVLIILKKKAPTVEAEAIKEDILDLLRNSGLSSDQFSMTHGTSQASGEAEDSVIGGRFNDNVEIPKDPITFALNALIGFQNVEHLGGTFLLAQKIDLNWAKIRSRSKNLETIVGRLQIEGNPDNDSSIISQNWCPHAHIKHSRVKDQFGNPVSMARQSKPYFDEEPLPGMIAEERGIFFAGYLNNWENILRIIDNQMSYDAMVEFFETVMGGILYVPSLHELGLRYKTHKTCTLSEICSMHKISWSNHFPGVQEPSHSPYLFYTRNEYMQRMSIANPADQIVLEPPTARTLRVLSKTFALWQDTWYYDRRQMQMGHLKDYLANEPIKVDINSFTSFDPNYPVNSIGKRQALAVYVELAHILTTEWYGCRGPNKEGKFGAGTFHVEPEDLLVGGEANLTFGQGKHLLNYLTEEERERLWMENQNLSQHSGVGHVVPHMDDLMELGLDEMMERLRGPSIGTRSGKKNPKKKDEKKDEKSKKEEKCKKEGEIEMKEESLKVSSDISENMIIALMGMKRYFENYAQLCEDRAAKLPPTQAASIKNLKDLAADLRHISKEKPVTFRQGAQLALSTFICLHITGEPVSIGRLDQHLGELIRKETGEDAYDPSTPEKRKKYERFQEIIDSFWIKVGQKVNLNKSFFEDHQKWGNLAMGGMSSPYPQGASFNQWGHQLTVGGCKRNGDPGYNAVTMLCLKAARRLPLNAPCLGLRVDENIPKIYLEEAAKAVLSGGAHPIFLNDHRVIPGMVQSGAYRIAREKWDAETSQVVDYDKFNCAVDIADARDYSSDGCYEFLLSGKCWFCLSGLPVLMPLELLLNEGKDLLNSGTRYIYGMRTHYLEEPLETLQVKGWDYFLDKYFEFFKTTVAKNFTNQLQNFGKLSNVFPTALLNAFTGGLAERGRDFYQNGAQYNLFCPQYTGVANLVNSLWNIRKYVFEQRTISLSKLRMILLNNWGKTMTEPFVPNILPKIERENFAKECEFWRMKILASEEKFGINEEVSEFGHRIAKKIAEKTVQIFSSPDPETLKLLKRLTKENTNEKVTFGLQIQPGCGTFENYQDNGISCGPSFDGRLRSQSLAEDFSMQPYFSDAQPLDKSYKFSTLLKNIKNPDFWSGSVLDFNIDEDFNEDKLVGFLSNFAENKEEGPNIITVTTCNRSNIEELVRANHKDLLRFRMGGWSEFGVAMFPTLLNHHIRRVRTHDS